jgi:hypothetical protein
MGILLRYACLIGVGLASIFAFVSATAVTGQRLAATGGYAVQNPTDSEFMVLALIGALGFLSVANFVLRGFPSLIRNWYERRKGSIAALMMAGVVCIVFLVT